MGHYAAEMQGREDKKTKRIREDYYKVREELENTPSGQFSVLELAEAMKLLTDKQTPSHFDRDPSFALDKTREIKKLLKKRKKLK